MKKIKRITAMVIAAIMCLSLTSCSIVDESDTDITNDNIKIGIMYPGKAELGEGEVNDLATITTLKSIVALTNIGYGIGGDRFKYREQVDPTSADAVADAVQGLINLECNIIFLTDSRFVDTLGAAKLQEIAKENDRIQFVTYNSAVQGDNIHTYNANVTGVSYLAGIAAGMKAAELKVNLIGYLVGNAKDLTTLNAFAEGAKSVNKDVKISAKVATNDKADAEALVKSGCVVLASDFYSEDIDNVANANNIFFCGFGNDGYTDADYEGETSYLLCSPMYDFAQCYVDMIKGVVDDTGVKDYAGGYVTGSTYLSDVNDLAADGTAKAIKDAETKLADGTLKMELSASVAADNVTLAK